MIFLNIIFDLFFNKGVLVIDPHRSKKNNDIMVDDNSSN